MHKQYTSMTQDERQERDEARRADAKLAVDTSVQALLAEVRAGKSERLIAWFDFCSAFHHYSPANQWLIASQLAARGMRPSFVASYADWQRIGQQRHGKPYRICKGEKALAIWLPRIYKKDNESEDAPEVIRGFIVRPCVFDASQIDQGEGQPPLANFWEPQADSESARALYSVLRAQATAQGFTCREKELAGGLQGYSQGTEIVIKRGTDATTAVNTFIHELAHGLMHQKPQDDGTAPLEKRERECEAEAVAYIVARHFGIENVFSSDYLQMYGVDAAVLTARLTRIRSVAHSIIAGAETALAQEVAA